MDTDKGPATHSLINELRRRPHAFQFFQAVRLLEQHADKLGSTGQHGPLHDEPLRFRANLSLAFPKADLDALDAVSMDEQTVWRMTVNFMGLYGSASPLPPSMSEAIMHSDAQRDAEIEGGDSNKRVFLDVFHHRLIGLFYRTYTKYRYYTQYRPGAVDPFSDRVYALMGFRTNAVRQAAKIDVRKLLPFAGLLSMRVRSATTLCRILSHYFDGIGVRVEEYVARWTKVEDIQQTVLGEQNCALGESALAGDEVLDRASMFRLWLGPLCFEQYAAHLPDGHYHNELRALVRVLLGDQHEYEVALELRAPEVPMVELSSESKTRLGWSCWLEETPQRDVNARFDGGVEQL